MNRVKTYRLDDKVVNAETFYISIVFKLLFWLLGIFIIAGALPYSFGQVFMVVLGITMILGAKTIVLTFSD